MFLLGVSVPIVSITQFSIPRVRAIVITSDFQWFSHGFHDGVGRDVEARSFWLFDRGIYCFWVPLKTSTYHFLTKEYHFPRRIHRVLEKIEYLVSTYRFYIPDQYSMLISPYSLHNWSAQDRILQAHTPQNPQSHILNLGYPAHLLLSPSSLTHLPIWHSQTHSPNRNNHHHPIISCKTYTPPHIHPASPTILSHPHSSTLLTSITLSSSPSFFRNSNVIDVIPFSRLHHTPGARSSGVAAHRPWCRCRQLCHFHQRRQGRIAQLRREEGPVTIATLLGRRLQGVGNEADEVVVLVECILWYGVYKCRN